MNKTILCLTLVLITSGVSFAKGKPECKRKVLCQRLKNQETALDNLIKRVEELEKEPNTPEPAPTTPEPAPTTPEPAPTTPEPTTQAPPKGEGFDISFSGKDGYANTNSAVPSLNAFTFCTWLKASIEQHFDDEGFAIVFLYGPSTSDYEVAFYRDEESVAVQIQYRATQWAQFNKDAWQHFCVTWENTAGTLKFYRDGAIVLTKADYAKGIVLNNNGVPQLGQDPDGEHPYVGDLNGFNMWDHVLSGEEISRMSTECNSGEGNVLNWSDFKSGVHGDARVVEPSTCSP